MSAMLTITLADGSESYAELTDAAIRLLLDRLAFAQRFHSYSETPTPAAMVADWLDLEAGEITQELMQPLRLAVAA